MKKLLTLEEVYKNCKPEYNTDSIGYHVVGEPIGKEIRKKIPGVPDELCNWL